MSEIEWKISQKPVEYEVAVQVMEERVAAIKEGTKFELIWMVEHPPCYTAGTSAQKQDLLNPQFPVYQTGRGGQYTYHGPGQRVVYIMLDLKRRQEIPDIKRYIFDLEQWIIDSLQVFDISGERREGRVGIWVENNSREGVSKSESKIAAIGVRVRHWITYHGISINLNPDLSHFSGIVPCGINTAGVTSFEDLGVTASMDELDTALQFHCTF
ncbi:MAG: lipoyl(octanoyl) transferase LipB [Pseudomonadota bacterium]